MQQVATGLTDSRGQFGFGYPSTHMILEESQLDCGETCSLWADLGDGWQLVEVFSRFSWGEEGDPDPQFQVQSRDSEFRNHVQDQHGSPLSGAALQLIAGEHGSPVSHLPDLKTDRNGALRMGSFAHGSWLVDISCPGYAPVRTWPYQFLPSDPESRVYEVTLLPAREVIVQALQTEGHPAANARIAYTYGNENLPTFSMWTCLTDADGRAVISVPTSGDYVVEALAPGVSVSPCRRDDTK